MKRLKTFRSSNSLTDNEKNEELAVFTSNAQTGRYLVSLPSGKNYGIAVKKRVTFFIQKTLSFLKMLNTKKYKKIFI